MNRREFVGYAVAAGCLPGRIRGASQTDSPLKVEPFPLRDVQLLEGPWANLVEKNREYLHALEADRLLRRGCRLLPTCKSSCNHSLRR
jgi:hypothetical protein